MDHFKREKCIITNSKAFSIWSQVYKDFWGRRQPDLMSMTSDAMERGTGVQPGKEWFTSSCS